MARRVAPYEAARASGMAEEARRRSARELAHLILTAHEARLRPPAPRPQVDAADPWAAIHRVNALSGSSAAFNIAGRTAQQLGEAIIYSPAGAVEAGRAVGLDTRDITSGLLSRADEAIGTDPVQLGRRDLTPSRTADLGEAIGEEYARTYGPLLRGDTSGLVENPGYVLLDLLAAGSLGASAGVRATAAGRAARAASGPRRVSQALVRRPSEGGSLLRRPAPGRVEIAEGVSVPLSRNPLAAAFQRRRLERQAERPESRTAGNVLGRNLQERVGKERRREQQILDDVERAEPEGLRARARKLDRAEQTAVRVVAERQPVAARIRAHERDLAAITRSTPAAAASRLRIKRKIRLLEQVERRGLVENVDGIPRPSAALLEVYERSVASGGRREKAIEELGLATREQLEARRAAPGRVIEGAAFETGRGSRRAERRVERTERDVARQERAVATLQGRVSESEQRTRPLTIAEAEKRITDIDRKWWQLVDAAASATEPANLRQAVVYRNRENRKLRARGRPAKPTVKQEARQAAEREVLRMLEQSEHPAARRFLAELDEGRKLRAGLEKIRGRADELIPEEAIPPTRATARVRRELLGTVNRDRDAKLGAVLQHEERKLRKALRKLEGAKGAAAAEPARGLRGAEDVEPGELFVRSGSRRRLPTSRAQAGSPEGLGIPRGNVLHGTYTGESFRQGRFPNKAVRAVAEDELEVQRYRSVLRIRETALAESIDSDAFLALPEKTRKHFIPVRTTEKPYRADTKEFLDLVQRKLDDGERLTRKERANLDKRADVARERVFPDLEQAQALAAAAKGEVRFVDERRLGGLNREQGVYGIGGKLATAADEVNAASTIAILHLKPAYAAPNLLGQSALTLIQQGALAPWNARQAVLLYRTLTPEERAKVRAASGLGLAKALPVERSRIFRPARDRLANAWSKVLDSPFRWMAFVHEARLLGYNTPAKIRRLVDDEGKLDDLLEVSKRTRDAMIDYSNLSRIEARLLRRIVFFWPWLAGSGRYTGRYARDHPVQAAALAELAREGQQKAENDLGPVPWYMRGSFKVGEDDQGRSLVVNPRAAQLFESPAQAFDVARGLVSGDPNTERIEGLLTPAVGAVGQLIRPHDPLGGYPLDSTLEGLSRELVESLPQYRLQEELRHPTDDDEDRLYPTSRAGALRKFGVGTIYPRPVNPDVLRERAFETAGSHAERMRIDPERAQEKEERDRFAAMEPVQRATAYVLRDREQMLLKARRLGLLGEDDRLPEPLREAWVLQAWRRAAWAEAEGEAGEELTGRPLQLVRWSAEVALGLELGFLTAEQATEALQQARSMTAHEISQMREFVAAEYFGGEALRDARRQIREAGGDL